MSGCAGSLNDLFPTLCHPLLSLSYQWPNLFERVDIEPGPTESSIVSITAASGQDFVFFEQPFHRLVGDLFAVWIPPLDGTEIGREFEGFLDIWRSKRMSDRDHGTGLGEDGPRLRDGGNRSRDVTGLVVTDQPGERRLEIVLGLGVPSNGPSEMGTTDSRFDRNLEFDTEMVLETSSHPSSTSHPVALELIEQGIESLCPVNGVSEEIETILRRKFDFQFETPDDCDPITNRDRLVEIGMQQIVICDGHGLEASVFGHCRQLSQGKRSV